MAKFCSNCGKELNEGADICLNCGKIINENINMQNNTKTNPNAKSKIAAGILGIILGCFGVHNFYLGFTGKAVAQLLITIISCFFLFVKRVKNPDTEKQKPTEKLLTKVEFCGNIKMYSGYYFDFSLELEVFFSGNL